MRAQFVARMVGRGTQEQGHGVCVEHFSGIDDPSQRVVICFGQELKVRASLGDLVDLSLPAARHGSKNARAHHRHPAPHQLTRVALGRVVRGGHVGTQMLLRSFHRGDGFGDIR